MKLSKIQWAVLGACLRESYFTTAKVSEIADTNSSPGSTGRTLASLHRLELVERRDHSGQKHWRLTMKGWRLIRDRETVR